MLIKRSEHHIKFTPLCGEISEILTNRDNPHLDVAIAHNISTTNAHYHKGFEEIYLVIDGWIAVTLYDSHTQTTTNYLVGAHEILVIAPYVHHKITDASPKNRLVIICRPGFCESDVHVSHVLETYSDTINQ